MRELETYTCIPCSRGEHHQCRPEWECGCNHLRDLTPVPAAATAAPASPTGPPPVAEAEAALGAAGVWGSAPDAPDSPPGPDTPPSGPGAPRCRFAGGAHVCRSSFGMPIRPGATCFEEAKARLSADHPLAVGEVRIRGLADVAVRLAEKLAPMDRAVGQ